MGRAFLAMQHGARLFGESERHAIAVGGINRSIDQWEMPGLAEELGGPTQCYQVLEAREKEALDDRVLGRVDPVPSARFAAHRKLVTKISLHTGPLGLGRTLFAMPS